MIIIAKKRACLSPIKIHFKPHGGAVFVAQCAAGLVLTDRRALVAICGGDDNTTQLCTIAMCTVWPARLRPVIGNIKIIIFA